MSDVSEDVNPLIKETVLTEAYVYRPGWKEDEKVILLLYEKISMKPYPQSHHRLKEHYPDIGFETPEWRKWDNAYEAIDGQHFTNTANQHYWCHVNELFALLCLCFDEIAPDAHCLVLGVIIGKPVFVYFFFFIFVFQWAKVTARWLVWWWSLYFQDWTIR